MSILHFPPTIDATLVSSFRGCPQKAYRQYFQHWKPKGQSVHLVAGGAFAKGIEVARRAYYENIIPVWAYTQLPSGHTTSHIIDWTPAGEQTPDSAVGHGVHAIIRAYGTFDPPEGSAKTCERVAGALEYYFSQYPLAIDNATPITFGSNKRGIEFSFAEPLDILHPETGAPLIYTGRADMLADFAGAVYAVDEKTTSSLGPSWGKQWQMRSQFIGYGWAAGKMGIQTAGTLVRGVSILKTKYETQQVLVGFQPWEVERWYEQTQKDIHRMIACWKQYTSEGDSAFDYDLDSACNEYGGCPLTIVCKSREPNDWLPMYFEQRVWDPLAHVERTVDEWNDKWFGTGNRPG